MAAQQVVVQIVDGLLTVEAAIRRPVRLTPNGYAGIVYAGAVYPLFADNIVDVAGPSWEVEDCNRFLLADRTIPYAPREDAPRQQFIGFEGEWTLESNRFGHYVVFNAPEREATEVVDALEAAGVSIQRWDTSHRAATDGRFYDWFARLRFRGTHEDAMALVKDVFTPPSPSAAETVVAAPKPTAPTRLEELETQVEELVNQVVDLRERIHNAESESILLKERLAAANSREAKLSRDLDRALEHQKSLHVQIADLSRSSEQSAETKALLAQQSDTEELLEYALAENSDLRHKISVVREQAEESESRILTSEAKVERLQQQLEELGQLEQERRRATQARVAPRRGVIGFLDTAFARLNFVLDSSEVLANLDSPSSIIRALVQIDMGENVGRDLESASGWREVSKLATGIIGSESMGRIYYKPDGNQVLVSVHVKQNEKEQRRHIERLRSL